MSKSKWLSVVLSSFVFGITVAALYLNVWPNPLILIFGKPDPVMVPEPKEQTVAELNALAGVKIEPEPQPPQAEDLGVSERALGLLKLLAYLDGWVTLATETPGMIRYQPGNLVMYYEEKTQRCTIRADGHEVAHLFSDYEQKRIGEAFRACYAAVKAEEQQKREQRALEALNKALQKKGS